MIVLISSENCEQLFADLNDLHAQRECMLAVREALPMSGDRDADDWNRQETITGAAPLNTTEGAADWGGYIGRFCYDWPSPSPEAGTS